MFAIAPIGVTLLLSLAPVQQPSRCEPTTIADVRRQDAIRFLSSFNAIQAESHRRVGTYLALSDVPNVQSLPVGFVPRLVFDRWTYVITLADLFDRCGFVLMSDERGIVYEGQPVTADRPGDASR